MQLQLGFVAVLRRILLLRFWGVISVAQENINVRVSHFSCRRTMIFSILALMTAKVRGVVLLKMFKLWRSRCEAGGKLADGADRRKRLGHIEGHPFERHISLEVFLLPLHPNRYRLPLFPRCQDFYYSLKELVPCTPGFLDILLPNPIYKFHTDLSIYL